MRDGETGYHFSVGDISGMAKILRSLLENVPLQRELGQNGKAFVEKTFTLKNMCSAEISAYKKVLKVKKEKNLMFQSSKQSGDLIACARRRASIQDHADQSLQPAEGSHGFVEEVSSEVCEEEDY